MRFTVGRTLKAVAPALAMTLALAVGARDAKAQVTFSGSSGNLAASATFQVVGGNLQVTLTNTSSVDVMVPADVLSAVFFNITGDPALSRISALVAAGSTVIGASQPTGGVVGGEWAYDSGLSGAPHGATQGISSSGLNWFGPNNRFPGDNLAGPDSPDGIQYGITSAGDDPSTHNGGADVPLIKNSVVFTLGALPVGFDLSSISNVSFQYGTSTSEPNYQGFPPSSVPEGSSLALMAGGLLPLMGGMALFRRTKKAA